MTNKRCYYFTEGKCEEKLIQALKLTPALLLPGKVKVFNVIQNLLPVSILMSIDPGSLVVLVFDTDKDETEQLKRNIDRIKKQCAHVEVLTIAQVRNFEDEIVRATNVNKAQELTKSIGINHFKSDFCKMKNEECRNALERHKLTISELWRKEPPQLFSFVKQDGEAIKLNRTKWSIEKVSSTFESVNSTPT